MKVAVKRSTILAALFLAALPLAAQTPPYVRTVIVGGAGAPLVNGTNLINALAAIPAPGPANRWLVKIEPGTFDIGVLSLVLRDYVDIEGSGRGVTVVTSILADTGTGATVTAPAGVHAEVRELTVENRCSNNGGRGIHVQSGDVRLSRIHVDVQTPVRASGIALGANAQLVEVSVRAQCTWDTVATAVSTGISIQDSSPILQDVSIVTEGSAIGLHRGLRAENSSAILDRLRVQAPLNPASGAYAEGIVLTSTTGATFTPQISNSQITVGATGSGSQAFGIYVSGGSGLQPEIRNTKSKALNASFVDGAIVLLGANVTIVGSSLVGQGTTGIGVQSGAPGFGGGTVKVNQSTVEGSTWAYANVAGFLYFGASGLFGNRPLDPNVTCGSSFNTVYAPLNGPC